MSRNPELTRSRLIDAGTREFSRRGLAGARVDEIARVAGANKERIYQYFGSKHGLFAAVLEHNLTEAAEAVSLHGDDEQAIIEYAYQLATRHREDPTLARLLHWEALELAEPVAADARREQLGRKVDALMKAEPRLDRETAAQLLVEILMTANSSAVLTNIARTMPVDANPGFDLRARMTRLVRSAVR